MRRKGFTLVEIMIVVAIVALLAAIAIPNLLRARINANETNAQALLKTLSTACETYAAANAGNYPAAMLNLTGGVAPYLNEDYTTSSRQGYNFSCPTMNTARYLCRGVPVVANSTGTRSFSICTGGVLREQAGGVAPVCP